MAAESGDPHTIGKILVGEDEYQAPPRDESEPQAEVDDGTLERLEDQAPEEPVDINLLEAQQGPGISTPIQVAPSDKKNIVVSGPDERTQPGGPQAPPPGESM
jgi:hypothetical protein